MVWQHYWKREEWEYDFSNPPRVAPPYPIFEKPYMCQHCKQYTTTPHWAVKDIGRSTMQYGFCNEDHAQDYWLGLLRKDGL